MFSGKIIFGIEDVIDFEISGKPLINPGRL